MQALHCHSEPKNKHKPMCSVSKNNVLNKPNIYKSMNHYKSLYQTKDAECTNTKDHFFASRHSNPILNHTAAALSESTPETGDSREPK